MILPIEQIDRLNSDNYQIRIIEIEILLYSHFNFRITYKHVEYIFFIVEYIFISKVVRDIYGSRIECKRQISEQSHTLKPGCGN